MKRLHLVLLLLLPLLGLLGYAHWPEERLPAGVIADAVLVEKEGRRLTLLRNGVPLKSYRVSLGREPIGHKVQEGDGRTPEGSYVIESRNPRSGYHLSLRISYPDSAAIRRARELGVSPGGDIMIHGIRNGAGWLGRLHRRRDWTQGCIAVTNSEMREIWRAVPDGTPIEVRP